MSAQIAPELVGAPHVRPIGSQIVVLAIAEERKASKMLGLDIDVRKSAGGVDLPDIVDNDLSEGRVVALGTGVSEPLDIRLAERCAKAVAVRMGISTEPDGGARFVERIAAILLEESAKPRPFTVKVGDRVLWTPWMATTVILEEVEYNVIDERDVVGIFPE